MVERKRSWREESARQGLWCKTKNMRWGVVKLWKTSEWGDQRTRYLGFIDVPGYTGKWETIATTKELTFRKRQVS
jgi:hypothetical protein